MTLETYADISAKRHSLEIVNNIVTSIFFLAHLFKADHENEGRHSVYLNVRKYFCILQRKSVLIEHRANSKLLIQKAKPNKKV